MTIKKTPKISNKFIIFIIQFLFIINIFSISYKGIIDFDKPIEFLLFPNLPRGEATANSVLTYPTDISALKNNPAGLCALEQKQVSGSTTYMFKHVIYQWTGFVVPIDKGRSGFGASITYSYPTLYHKDLFPNSGSNVSLRFGYGFSTIYDIKVGYALNLVYQSGLDITTIVKHMYGGFADISLGYKLEKTKSNISVILKNAGMLVNESIYYEKFPMDININFTQNIFKDAKLGCNFTFPLQPAIYDHFKEPYFKFGIEIPVFSRFKLLAGYYYNVYSESALKNLTAGIYYSLYNNINISYAITPDGTGDYYHTFSADFKFWDKDLFLSKN